VLPKEKVTHCSLVNSGVTGQKLTTPNFYQIHNRAVSDITGLEADIKKKELTQAKHTARAACRHAGRAKTLKLKKCDGIEMLL